MRIRIRIIFLLAAALTVRADEVDMQNGDRYIGKVLSVSGDTVVLQSDILGKLNVPRKNVSALAFGTNAVVMAVQNTVRNTPAAGPTNFSNLTGLGTPGHNSPNPSATIHPVGAGTNVVNQIREQMLAGSPAAAAKYDQMVSGLLSGSLNVDDVRREAQADVVQLRALKRDLGPDADDSIDGYLQVLDAFVKSSEFSGPTNGLESP
ncbi:MAG TPA: hypothetical protein VG347_18275 [Verrucomicrobiae bacterium]|nr:hypothetical protein [Verrucomicrobiae bacterium]